MNDIGVVITLFRKDQTDINSDDIDRIRDHLADYQAGHGQSHPVEFSYLIIQAISDQCLGITVILDEYEPDSLDLVNKENLIDFLAFDDEFAISLFQYLKERVTCDYSLLLHYCLV